MFIVANLKEFGGSVADWCLVGRDVSNYKWMIKLLNHKAITKHVVVAWSRRNIDV